MNRLYLFLLSTTLLCGSTQEALNAYKNHHYQEAFKLYQDEAQKNDSNAQSALSYLYFNGIGTQKNNKKGLIYLQKAAQNGNVTAALDLGIYYLKGDVVKKDMQKAAKWLEVAADKGNAEAQYNLAIIYYNGDGVKQNINKATELLEKAAKNGHKGARKNIGRIYMQALNFKKAKYWLNENLKDGDKEAALLLKEIEAAHKE
jgi:TPR repeat protein